MLAINDVVLRPFESRDLDLLCSARNDLAIEAAAQPCQPRPTTRALYEARLASGVSALSSGEEGDIEFVVARAGDDEERAIGIAGLYEVDRHNRIAELGVTIADPSARRTGIGIDSYVALAIYAFKTLGLHKLYGHVKASNVAARGTLERLGLVREGVLREHRWEQGEHVDLLVYRMLASEWDPRVIDWRTTSRREAPGPRAAAAPVRVP